MDKESLNKKLVSGLELLGLKLSSAQILQLVRYLELLNKWNKVYSLTAINDLSYMVTYHVLDGLAGAKYFANSSSILDVGSGMGVPGILLGIIYPQIKVDLIDSNSKKCSFLRQVKIELGLKNITIYNKRVESLEAVSGYDIVTSRAFADMELFYNLTRNLLSNNGMLLAYKGSNIESELKNLLNLKLEIIPLIVPNLEAKRYLVSCYDKKSSN